MDRGRWQELVNNLRGAEYPFGQNAAGYLLFHRVEFDAGLTDDEVIVVERRFGFQFPPDLREFLQTALPRGLNFPDWRFGDEAELRDWLDLPRQGVLFDVEHNGFWLDSFLRHATELGATQAVTTTTIRFSSTLAFYGV
jgi:hypothetical protein